jgi:hypothetical protein
MDDQYAKIRTRLTLAEAVMLLAAGRTASPALERLREHGPLHCGPPLSREELVGREGLGPLLAEFGLVAPQGASRVEELISHLADA